MLPSTTPKILLPSVWPLPISLATTFGISVDYFSSPYLDVSVQAVPHTCLFDSACADRITPAGFPHSDIPGSQLICSSPRLFAAYHVLHRLLMPRHSPCALINLTNALLSAALTSFAEKSISGFSFVSELCRLIKKFSLAEIVSITLKNLFPYCCLLITFLILCSVFKVHL